MTSAYFSSGIAAGWRQLLFLLFLGLPAMGMASGADDDCIYNPAAFREMLSQLRHKYSGAAYTKDHRGVTISISGGKATVSYGGCEHYGTEISFAPDAKVKYSREQVFAKAVALVRDFGQGRVDPKILQDMLRQGKFTVSPYNPGIIDVPYPLMDSFSIEAAENSDGTTTIDISFYN